MPSKSASDNSCPTHLIVDAVTDKDDFEHEQIALSIADLIWKEEGGCAIALTGSWGSGKSTVVELLRKKLSKDQHTETFVFDAWAHQGDPLRRSFLEKLISWFKGDVKWITNNERWDKVVEQLARRSETSTSKSTGRLTKLGACAAILLLLAPVAFQLYQKIQYVYHPYWSAIVLLLGATPVLLGLVILFVALVTGKTHLMLGLFLTSTGTETTSETSKTADPTSVEFEKYYRELLTEVLSAQERRVLLVVDNLDRVNHDDARAMWAALRVFFDPSLRVCCDWYNRVWVLVPL